MAKPKVKSVFDANAAENDGRIAKPGSAEEAAALDKDAEELERTKAFRERMRAKLAAREAGLEEPDDGDGDGGLGDFERRMREKAAAKNAQFGEVAARVAAEAADAEEREAKRRRKEEKERRAEEKREKEANRLRKASQGEAHLRRGRAHDRERQTGGDQTQAQERRGAREGDAGEAQGVREQPQGEPQGGGQVRKADYADDAVEKDGERGEPGERKAPRCRTFRLRGLILRRGRRRGRFRLEEPLAEVHEGTRPRRVPRVGGRLRGGGPAADEGEGEVHGVQGCEEDERMGGAEPDVSARARFYVD